MKILEGIIDLVEVILFIAVVALIVWFVIFVGEFQQNADVATILDYKATVEVMGHNQFLWLIEQFANHVFETLETIIG